MNPRFLFDFASPNCYLAHKLIPGIEARTGVTFDYVPVLLGGLFKLSGNQAPMLAFAGIPNKIAYENLEFRRFMARHNIDRFQMNPHFPVNTLMLMRGMVAAEMEGVLHAYVEAGLQYMWEAPRKMDDAATLTATLAEAGLPADRLMARAQDQDVKDRLAANTNAAYAAGAFGLPSFLFGDDLWFGKDRLTDVEAALTAAG